MTTPTPVTLTDQGAEEPRPEYAARVLRYGLRFGVETFTRAQLEICDAAAQESTTRLPATLADQPGAATLDRHLHALRLRVAARLATYRRQLTALQRQLDALDTGTPDDQDAPAPAQAAQATETDQDRALRLLRAALLLIMTPPPPRSNGGGRPAPLQPPPPGKGPGSHADARTPAPPGRRF